MNSIMESTKTTLIGGLPIFRPSYVAVLLPAKAMKSACPWPAGSPARQTTS